MFMTAEADADADHDNFFPFFSRFFLFQIFFLSQHHANADADADADCLGNG